MRTTLLERTQQQAATVEAPGHGTVTRLYVAEGEEVKRGAQLGIFVGAGGMEGLKAPAAGVVRVLVKVGQPIDQGSAIATVTPLPPKPAPKVPQPRAKAPLATPRAPTAAPRPEPSPDTKSAPRPVQAASEPPPHPAPSNGRRSNGLRLEELTVEQPPILPRRRERPPRPRIIKWMFHCTDDQRDDFNERLARLLALGGDYAAAELQRVAVALLLELSDNELVKRLEAQRDHEQASGYGWGNRPA